MRCVKGPDFPQEWVEYPAQSVYAEVTNLCALYEVVALWRACSPTLQSGYTVHRVSTGTLRSLVHYEGL